MKGIKRVIFNHESGQELKVTVSALDVVRNTWRWQSYCFGGREAVTVSGPWAEPEEDGTMWVDGGVVYLDHPMFEKPHVYPGIDSGFASSL